MRTLIIIAAAMLSTAAAPVETMPAWMAGCWIEEKADRWTEECWTSARGDIMLGSGRSGRAAKLGSWEAMRIERSAAGKLVFHAAEKEAPRVAFPMVSANDREIVFANPQHDYPQRIRYWRDGEELRAETSLMDGSKAMAWRYRRSG